MPRKSSQGECLFSSVSGGGMEEVFLTLNGRNKPGRQNEGGSFLRCPFCLSLPQRFAAFREACFSKCSGFMAFDEFPGCFQVGVRRSSGRIMFKNGVAETGGLPSRMERG